MKLTYQNTNTKTSLREMLQKIENKQLHHQHTQASVKGPLEMMSRAAHQDQLLKLYAVLEQEHHGVQQLALETARQEPSREGGGAK